VSDPESSEEQGGVEVLPREATETPVISDPSTALSSWQPSAGPDTRDPMNSL
jgi:hypothetical protein